MTAPITGFQGVGSGRRIGLDVAGEGGFLRLQPDNPGPSFAETLKRALNEVSTTQETSQDYIARFVRGEPVELHQVMAAAEANLSIEMLVEMRNKLMDAYRTIVTMT